MEKRITVLIHKEEVFAEVININQYYNGDVYTYTYKYYDTNGNLVKEHP